jgi:hypothetical protein
VSVSGIACPDNIHHHGDQHYQPLYVLVASVPSSSLFKQECTLTTPGAEPRAKLTTIDGDGDLPNLVTLRRDGMTKTKMIEVSGLYNQLWKARHWRMKDGEWRMKDGRGRLDVCG